MKTLIVILVLILFITFCFSKIENKSKKVIDEIECNLKTERVFNYVSVVHSFQGKEKHSNKGEMTGLKAEVGLACIKKWMRSDGKSLYLWSVHIRNVELQMKKDSNSGWENNKTHNKTHHKTLAKQNSKNLDKYFKHFTGFTSSSNGKIYKVYQKKDEEAWVSGMKKSILEQLQTKLNGKKNSRKEKNSMGIHKSHYKKKLIKGKLYIEKKYSDKDVKPTSTKNKNHKEMKLKSKSEVIIDKNGNVIESIKKQKITLGTHSRHKRKGFKRFFREKNIPFEKHENYKTGNSHFLNAKEVSELKFNFKKPYKRHHKFFKVIIPLRDPNSKNQNLITTKHPKIKLHPSFIETDLTPTGIHQYSQQMRKQYLKQEINFNKMIKQLRKDPDDLILAAKAQEYIEHFKDSIKIVYKEFEDLFKKSQNKQSNDNDDFLKLAQTLILSAENLESQKLFLKTLKNQKLIKHGIIRTIEVENPTDILINFLKKYAEKFAKKSSNEKMKNPENDEEENQQNGYLCYADLASRLPEEKALPIIELIINQLVKNESNNNPYEPLIHLHALGNAGKGPIKILKQFIESPFVHDHIKIISIQALRKRDNIEEDQQINDLIHNIVSGNYHPSVKHEAVKIQTLREKLLRNGASLDFFKKYLIDDLTNGAVKDEIYKYFIECGTKKASKILENIIKFENEFINENSELKIEKMIDFLSKSKIESQNEENINNYEQDDDDQHQFITESDSLFLRRAWRRLRRRIRRIGRRIRRIVRRIRRVVRRIVRGIGNALKKVKNAIAKVKNAFKSIKNAFAKASFKGNKVCLPGSSDKKDKICLYNSHMVNFVSKQGNLAVMTNAKHFEFEKLIGCNKLHLYLGLFFYSGTSFSCKRPAKEFNFVLAGKALAKAKLFKKDYQIVSAEAVMRQQGKYYDKIYLKVIDSVIVNRNILNHNQINYCKKNKKKLADKNFPRLPGFSFTVMLGPIPLSFGFKLAASASIGQEAGWCSKYLNGELGIVPKIAVGINAHAAINILIAKAGVEICAKFNYGLYPHVKIEGNKCQVCGVLSQRVKPMNVDIKAFAKINLGIIKKSVSKKVFGWGSKEMNNNLFKKCVKIKRK